MKSTTKYAIYGICTLILLGVIILHTITVDHSAKAQEACNYICEQHQNHIFD